MTRTLQSVDNSAPCAVSVVAALTTWCHRPEQRVITNQQHVLQNGQEIRLRRGILNHLLKEVEDLFSRHVRFQPSESHAPQLHPSSQAGCHGTDGAAHSSPWRSLRPKCRVGSASLESRTPSAAVLTYGTERPGRVSSDIECKELVSYMKFIPQVHSNVEVFWR